MGSTEGTSVAQGIVGAVYGDVFPAVRALGPLTPVAFVVLLAQQVIVDAGIGPVHFTDGSFQAWGADIISTLLLIPFQVAVFDFARRGRRPFLDHLWANGVGTLRYAAYYMLTSYAVVALYPTDFERANLSVTLPLLVGATALLWWIEVRLFVIGPALALSGLPVGIWDAVRATRGRFWAITSAWFQVTGLYLLCACVAYLAIHYPARWLDLPIDIIDYIMIAAMGLIAAIIDPILTMKVYTRLGLAMEDQCSNQISKN